MESPSDCPSVVLSFDVEEHDRIEAAAGLDCPPALRRGVRRPDGADDPPAARPARRGRGEGDVLRASGEIARSHPRLVRDIADGRARGRVARVGPPAGPPVQPAGRSATTCGRARTRWSRRPAGRWSGTGPRRSASAGETGWAIDVLAEAGTSTTRRSSRSGTTGTASRTPRGRRSWPRASAPPVELPPATYRVAGPEPAGRRRRVLPAVPARGDGAGLRQLGRTDPAVGVLYFHPWEFDPDQPRLPLGRVARWRTYVGVGRSTARLGRLLARHAGRFRRAIDVVADLRPRMDSLPRFRLATAGVPVLSVECSPATP